MSATAEIERQPLTKKELAADHPTWCPGCGDFSVLALYFKLLQNRGLHHEKFVTSLFWHFILNSFRTAVYITKNLPRWPV